MRKFTLVVCFVVTSIYLHAQNVGIGTADPSRAKLEVHGVAGSGATSAIFGGDGTGISLQRQGPAIGFNQYRSSAAGNGRYMSSGYAAVQYFDPVIGTMVFDVFQSGAANALTDNGTRGFVLTRLGRVGIGLDAPLARLHVRSNTASSVNGVLYAENTQITNLDNIAIQGRSVNNTGAGIGGHFTGGFRGVMGFGESAAGATAIGVYGSVSGPGGTQIGVFGTTDGGGSTNYAGYFIGNTHVSGTLSKSAGTFKIDHPQDPLNKYLLHSFVESPDMMNVYNGNIVTDKNSEAIVKLPSYFEAENIDFKYQLTVIGQFSQAIILKEVEGNQFVIKTDKPNIKVSWQITGIRNDEYAKKYRVVAEVDKGADRGKYLHPELYDEVRGKASAI